MSTQTSEEMQQQAAGRQEADAGIFAVFFRAEEARAFDDHILTEEGTGMWVIRQDDGWVDATSRRGDRDAPPKAVKTWASAEEAGEFMTGWGGHPWHAVPLSWEVVPLIQVNKEVFDHYETATASNTAVELPSSCSYPPCPARFERGDQRRFHWRQCDQWINGTRQEQYEVYSIGLEVWALCHLPSEAEAVADGLELLYASARTKAVCARRETADASAQSMESVRDPGGGVSTDSLIARTGSALAHAIGRIKYLKEPDTLNALLDLFQSLGMPMGSDRWTEYCMSLLQELHAKSRTLEKVKSTLKDAAQATEYCQGEIHRQRRRDLTREFQEESARKEREAEAELLAVRNAGCAPETEEDPS